MNALIEILHRNSSQLSTVKNEKQVYQIMNDAVRDLLPNAYFIITRLQDEDLNFRIVHSFGFEKFIAPIRTLIGKDPFQMDFPFQKLSETRQQEFKSRHLVHFQEGIYGIVGGVINKTICKTIEKILNISNVYSISICEEENLLGGATLFIPGSKTKDKVLPDEIKLGLESMAFQASFAITRLRNYEKLLKKEKELRIEQARSNQIINQLDVVVWQAKGDGTDITVITDTFEKICGLTAAELKEKPKLWSELVHPEDLEIFNRSIVELMKHGSADNEYRIVRPDGTIIWLHDRKSIIFDKNGFPLQMGGIITDITRTKLLEERLLLKNYALDNSPSAVGFADLTGNITYVNNKYVELFGYEHKDEIVGKHISEFASTIDHPENVFSTLRRGEVYSGEGKPVRKDGSTFYSVISASPVIHKEKLLCMMAVFVDITDLKLMETHLKRSESRLMKLNKQKDRFLTIIAHDLKSPFNGMLGLLEIYKEEYHSFTDEQRRNMLNAAHEAAYKAFNLLLDLLEWARLQNNQIEMVNEVVDLNQIVSTIIEVSKNSWADKGIEVNNQIGESTKVKLDRNSIRTIMRNIFTNSIKFTPDNGRIDFRIKHFNDGFELSIQDSGVGMSADTIEKLFKLDENVSMPGTNNEKGTGLGLLICHEIAEKNNWKINVESQIGDGSIFRIYIPIDNRKK